MGIPGTVSTVQLDASQVPALLSAPECTIPESSVRCGASTHVAQLEMRREPRVPGLGSQGRERALNMHLLGELALLQWGLVSLQGTVIITGGCNNITPPVTTPTC